jgi:RNA polymerase sigma factor (sigma-70 family)
LIDRVVRFVARRLHLSILDTEEFASHVRFKLIDRNFAILRKFEQRSSISTYLTVVIERLCLDFCIAKWGKWRPSAAARRLGAVAIMLEQLIVREGITFDEAVGTLQTNHGVSETRADLHALLLQMPVRSGRRTDAFNPGAEDAISPDNSNDREDEHLAARLQTALTAALATLDADDQRLVRLRFGQGLAVAHIARMLNAEPKPLYRRLEQIISVLRRELTRLGIAESDITRIVGHPTLALSGVIADGPH